MDGAGAATEWLQHHMHWNLIDGTTALRAFHNGTIVFYLTRGNHAIITPYGNHQHRKKKLSPMWASGSFN